MSGGIICYFATLILVVRKKLLHKFYEHENSWKKGNNIIVKLPLVSGEIMSVNEYRRRRNFKKTTEPKGDATVGKRGIYVIQRHLASHLHFDLRLEMDGVLKSWAVPKEPPTAIGVKRLAVQVEDHPVEYASFEGIIPEGEYGAGTVEIWDKGTHKLINRKDNKLIVEIKGIKLSGAYVLVRFKDRKNWLFFKKKETA